MNNLVQYTSQVKVVSQTGVNGHHAVQHVIKVHRKELENANLKLLMMNVLEQNSKKNLVTINLAQVRKIE